MDTSTEDTPRVRGRRVRTLWTVGAGTLAAAGLAGAIFAGVANANETSTGGDRTTQESETTPDTPGDGRNGSDERPDPSGAADREGMRDGGPRHGAEPDGTQPGDRGDCDEQHADAEADAEADA
jgi:hypothetical protein